MIHIEKREGLAVNPSRFAAIRCSQYPHFLNAVIPNLPIVDNLAFIDGEQAMNEVVDATFQAITHDVLRACKEDKQYPVW